MRGIQNKAHTFANAGRTRLSAQTRRIQIAALTVATAGAATFLLPTDVQSQSAGSFITLQAASPGTAQNGNSRISGTGIFGTAVRIGRTTAFSSNSFFDVKTPTGAGSFGGMFVETQSATGKPFYGYAANGSAKGWTEVDAANGNWHLVLNNLRHITVEPDGDVGIGNEIPFSKFSVLGNGDFTAFTTGAGNGTLLVTNSSTDFSSFGVKGVSHSNSFKCAGVYGLTQGSGASYGVFGQALLSSDGVGVFGEHSAATGDGAGVLGQTNSTAAGVLYPGPSGVEGLVTSATPGENAAGVRGVIFGSTSNGYGVFGLHSGSGSGVYGRATGGGGIGGKFISVGLDGPGVFSQSFSATGSGIGGHFISYAATGVGVQGSAFGTGANVGGKFSANGPASTGLNASSSGTGATFGGDFSVTSPTGIALRATRPSLSGGTPALYADSGSNLGGTNETSAAALESKISLTSPGSFSAAVRGINNGIAGLGVGVTGIQHGTGFGVYGFTSNTTSGFAGYFDGRLFAVSATAGIKAFRIDHPLDPENQYLQHSCVESPDMKNVYDGVVRLSANGDAVVVMPDYFEALNRDFRYQLTAIGGAAPNLHVADEISGNRFRIAGGAPGLKVSWQVTGIRHDPLANSQRIEVEVQKYDGHRGRYLHPEAYGRPRSEGTGAIQVEPVVTRKVGKSSP